MTINQVRDFESFRKQVHDKLPHARGDERSRYWRELFQTPQRESFSISKGSRYGEVSIERTPLYDNETWGKLTEALNKVIPVLLSESHPLLQRRDIDIRWISSMEYSFLNENDRVEGGCTFYSNSLEKQCVALNSHRLLANEFSHRSFLFYILHELAEVDYWLKANGEIPPLYDPQMSVEEYNKLPDEHFANEKALRYIQMVYPDFTYEKFT